MATPVVVSRRGITIGRLAAWLAIKARIGRPLSGDRSQIKGYFQKNCSPCYLSPCGITLPRQGVITVVRRANFSWERMRWCIGVVCLWHMARPFTVRVRMLRSVRQKQSPLIIPLAWSIPDAGQWRSVRGAATNGPERLVPLPVAVNPRGAFLGAGGRRLLTTEDWRGMDSIGAGKIPDEAETHGARATPPPCQGHSGHIFFPTGNRGFCELPSIYLRSSS